MWPDCITCQIHRDRWKHTHAHTVVVVALSPTNRWGLSCKNKPSLSGGLDDDDCLCTDDRERDGCLGMLSHTHTHTCFWMMSLWLAALSACSLLASAACLFFCCCCSLSCWILCSCSWTEAAWMVTTFPICADRQCVMRFTISYTLV